MSGLNVALSTAAAGLGSVYTSGLLMGGRTDRLPRGLEPHRVFLRSCMAGDGDPLML
ncbi:hypothetical protein OHA99_17850 [Streptomyces coelicoflavus]|uniref:hypothetical protein n=1 Tax=Streptomyces coelicoflavus TaxID=285562 RepID=UPI001884BF2E